MCVCTCMRMHTFFVCHGVGEIQRTTCSSPFSLFVLWISRIGHKSLVLASKFTQSPLAFAQQCIYIENVCLSNFSCCCDQYLTGSMLKGGNIYFIYFASPSRVLSFKKGKFWEQEIKIALHNVSSISKVTKCQYLVNVSFKK